MAIGLEVGASSCSSSRRFVSISSVIMAMPVMFPPGRLRLVTRPSWLGSAPRLKTMGMVDVAAFAATTAGAPPDRNDRCNAAADQVGRERRQPIILAVGPAVFHRYILVLDITDLFETLMKRGNIPLVRRC